VRIVIPTYRRVERQITLRNIPKRWHKRTDLIVDEVDAAYLKKTVPAGVSLIVHPPSVTSIAKKRKWILEHYNTTGVDKIMMFDDDLRFSRRRYSKPLKKGKPLPPFNITTASEEEIDWALRKVDRALDKYVHVGIGPRQGNNGILSAHRWYANSRMIYALGYRVPEVVEHCVLGRIEHREDMELCLQLLTQGYPNRVLVELVVDQTYNSKGGASLERNMTASNADAEKLAQMFPDFVKVVEREYKQSVSRKEVIVRWKKAYEYGRLQRSNGHSVRRRNVEDRKERKGAGRVREAAGT